MLWRGDGTLWLTADSAAIGQSEAQAGTQYCCVPLGQTRHHNKITALSLCLYIWISCDSVSNIIITVKGQQKITAYKVLCTECAGQNRAICLAWQKWLIKNLLGFLGGGYIIYFSLYKYLSANCVERLFLQLNKRRWGGKDRNLFKQYFSETLIKGVSKTELSVICDLRNFSKVSKNSLVSILQLSHDLIFKIHQLHFCFRVADFKMNKTRVLKS